MSYQIFQITNVRISHVFIPVQRHADADLANKMKRILPPTPPRKNV